jgi:PAS domain S-box-containing protein
MNNAEFQLRGVGDPRLAVYATSALPVWLWSIDGTRILWANPVGARLFGAANGAALTRKTFGPADQHRRQVAQLANRLPPNGAVRLERLRGFAPMGALVTCGCARLDFADGGHGVLVAAAEPIGRAMPLAERLARLVDGIDTPVAAFLSDGLFIGASAAARELLGFRNLNEAGLDGARNDALKQGRAETPAGIGHMVLQRVGAGADVGLVALLAPGAVQGAAAPQSTPPAPEIVATAPVVPEPEPQTVALHAEPTPTYEAPAMSGEAPTEFALVDEFADQPVVEHVVSGHAVSEPVISEHPADPEQPAVVAHEPSAVETPALETAAEIATAAAATSEATETATSPVEIQHEPSPYVEAVADEPACSAAEEIPAAAQTTPPTTNATPSVEATSETEEPSGGPRRHPLRFMWQMDADGRFTLGPDEFTRLIGPRTAAGFGRPWSEIAEHFNLDPEGHVARAIATRGTWSGITLDWPIDGGGRLPVELSGLPIYDYTGNLTGYRGFGICRDLDGLTRLDELRRAESLDGAAAPHTAPADHVEASAPDSGIEESHVPDSPAQDAPVEQPPNHEAPPHEALVADIPAAEPPPVPDVTAPDAPPETSIPIATDTSENSPPTDLETAVETPNEMLRNVVPFRPMSEPKAPVLTPVENNAFNELARQLSARLESENITFAPPVEARTTDVSVGPPAAAEIPATTQETVHETINETIHETTQETMHEQPSWLTRPEPPARGETRRDKALLDLIPVGILIYRLDRLLYANSAFLTRMGYESLHALEQAGGLDALYVEPGVSSASSTSDTGTPVTISASHDSAEHASPATDAHLFTISWDDESALALIFANAGAPNAQIAAAMTPAVEVSQPAVGHADAEDLGAILDTTAEGIVMFDAEGNINSCNRSAEALFGFDGEQLVQRNLVDLFAPESQPAVMDYLSSIKSNGVTSLLDAGREALARVHGGGLIPVSMTMGRTRHDGPNFFAVFRDLSQAKKSESELQQARRTADRAASAKADMLARISHEVRTPLNAIIGFAEVMIGERFGALGNERYVEYMKDIRASGERVIAIINDLLDLSRIETGKLDLAFANQNLNDLVESCVAVMQPQANRERIIIRTSLAHMLPPVIADARALRQITLNLIGNSIHLANAGGQVIVSTALSDFGEVVLRVRDTGHGLNDNEVAAAMEPFRTQPPSDQASDNSAVNLSLTKALVEANRARFQIKTGPRSGTLIEVLFSHAVARV